MTVAKDTRTFLQRVDDHKRATTPEFTPTATTPANVVHLSDDDGRRRGYAEKALRSECDLVAHAAEGTRNDTLNRAGFNLARFVADGILTADEITEQLTTAARAAGLPEQEIRATLGSAVRGAAAKPRDTPAVPPPRANGTVIEVPRSHLSSVTLDEHDDDDVPTPPTGIAHILDAEGDFWDSRDSLKQIRDAAMSRMCAPWAVLAHTAARALTGVRPCVTLPPLIGGRGSLNWFAAVAAPSGGGKGSASAVARDLVEDPVRERSMGSGEGITGAFYRPGTKNEPPEINEAVMFTADEVDTLTAMGSRTGSTTMSILRSGFAGETLGFSYITRGRDVHIEAHTYRMTLVVSVQPARAGALMGDHGGGTPQRFMWFPGIDPRIADDPGDHQIYPLSLPRPGEWQYPKTLTIPEEAKRLILSERAKAARGERAAIDGHAVFCREKFAFALALLDDRTEMNSEDWRLSGIAAEVSARTRDWVTAGLAAAADVEAQERGRLMGVTYAASDDEKAFRNTQRANRVARWALDKLEAGPMTQRELDRAVASRDRTWLKGALEGLSSAGVVGHDDDGRWVRL